MIGLGHHFFYTYLDQRQTNSFPQFYIILIATALAFLFKACVVSAVLIAYDQQLWHTFRRKSLKGSQINSLFAIPYSPFQLLDPRHVMKATLPWSLALLCWLIPLAAVFPPGSIEVVGHLRSDPSADLDAPSLNMQQDTTDVIAGFTGFAETCYNSPAQDIRRSTARTILDHAIVPFTSPCGSNCSYSLEFSGPAFQCRNSTYDSDNPQFGAITDAMYLEATTVNNSFWLFFTASTIPGDPPAGRVQAVSCETYEATYNLGITFSDNNLVVARNVEYGNLINWTAAEASCGGSTNNWAAVNMAAISQSVMLLLNGTASTTSISLVCWC